MANYNDFVEEIPITTYEQLMRILQGKTPNFREKYIFRGLSSDKHKLIPSALRKDANDNPALNNFIDSDFWVLWAKPIEQYYKEGKISKERFEQSKKNEINLLRIDKNDNVLKHDKINRIINSENEFHFKKELYTLLKFLDWTDRSGLKISTTPEIRRMIHENINYKPKNNGDWPHHDFLEIVSLAQHYGIPTEALDWSYDYNIAIYFAVKNVLEENNNDDCVLWALNYKLFEDSYIPNYKNHYHLQFYRPEYNTNPNLRAQKGLFTLITHKYDELDSRPVDEIVVEDFIRNTIQDYGDEKIIRIEGLGIFNHSKSEKLFYKFIIPNTLKHEILNELYLNGYSEEYLFPDYSGVVLAIENRVQLENYTLNKTPKINMIMSFNDNEIDNIFTNKKRIIFKRNIICEDINQIFIYSKESHEILGYFKGNEIEEYPPENLWFNFKEKSALSEDEFFKYFENSKSGYAIRINDLINFKYPIKIPDFELISEFYFIHPNNSKVNFLLNFEK